MGFVSAAADAVVALLSLTMAVAALLFDSQVVLPRGLYPASLVDIQRWFVAEFGHYLVADPPHFFRGLVWLDLAFWPVCVANLYGILARRPWAAATSIMAGVYMLTYMSAIFGEMLGSGRTTPKLIQLYVPFALAAVTAVLRGFCSCSAQATAVASHAPTARINKVIAVALERDLEDEMDQPHYVVAVLNAKASGVTWVLLAT
uniref:EXPERA domain-containing protein n=1 Tax=Oryza punctata TaxID=4537 RepID=A0A0E0KGT6_ORYPU